MRRREGPEEEAENVLEVAARSGFERESVGQLTKGLATDEGHV